jgi:hypothetical protein
MIIRVSKDLEHGSWDDEGEFTGTVIYAVITDSSDGISLFYDSETRRANGLPVNGDEYSPNFFVTGVSFNRREDKNFKDNGHLRSGSGSYAIWDYEVTLAYRELEPEINGSVAGGGATSNDYPDSLSISPKFYEVYDELQYQAGDIIGEPTGIVLDKAGKPMPTTRQVMNTVLNFSYKTRDFKFRYLDLALGTVNKEAVTVCGVDIPACAGKISNLSASYDTDSKKFTVTCEIEIGIQKNVYTDKLVSKGFYAKFPGFNTNKSGVEQAVRLQSTGSVAEGKALSESAEFKKLKDAKRAYGQYNESLYGFWGDANNNLQTQDPVIHDPQGRPYLGDETNIQTAIKNKLVGVVTKQLSVPASWKALGLPKKGFKD